MSRTIKDPKLDDRSAAEAILAATVAYSRAVRVAAMHSEQMRLMAGEMSAQEIRAVKAFVNYILKGSV